MARNVEVTEAAILVRINQLFRAGMSSHELYEATRGVWVLAERRERAEYAMAVFKGIVEEVYVVESWHEAGTTPYDTRSPEDVHRAGRWEFIGRAAPEEIRSRYVGGSVAHYWAQGAANPVRYVNC